MTHDNDLVSRALDNIRDAFDSIRDLNMLPADEHGHRWANSDLIDQEVTGGKDALRAIIAENERLREALKPFAEADVYYDSSFDDDYAPRWAEFFTIGDFRRALAALRKEGEA